MTAAPHDDPADPTPPAGTARAAGGRIVQAALERGVALRDDAEIAQRLRELGLDREIPPAALLAVADLLTCLTEADAALAAEADATAPPPDTDGDPSEP